MALEITVRKILNRRDDRVLWEGEAVSVGQAVEKAVSVGADLRDANLWGANLGGANLRDANLGGANLSGANLRDADLRDANLWGANLRDADLRDANLWGANLRDADLWDANLWGANLGGANLRDANLGGANLRGAARLPTGETWAEYVQDVVPALLTAGGKSIESFAEHWQCHTWENCPIAHAFSAPDLSAVPALLRPRADQFIRFFDAGLIPWELITGARKAQAAK